MRQVDSGDVAAFGVRDLGIEYSLHAAESKLSDQDTQLIKYRRRLDRETGGNSLAFSSPRSWNTTEVIRDTSTPSHQVSSGGYALREFS